MKKPASQYGEKMPYNADKQQKEWLKGKIELPFTPGEYEKRGQPHIPEDVVFSTSKQQ